MGTISLVVILIPQALILIMRLFTMFWSSVILRLRLLSTAAIIASFPLFRGFYHQINNPREQPRGLLLVVYYV